MDKMNIIKSIYFALVIMAGAQSCRIQEVETFSGDDKYVYFQRYIKNDKGESVRVDTVSMSFSHYYGVTEFTQDFYLGLIGQIPTEDLEYEVVVVDNLTTATPDQYSLPEKLVFRKGMLQDTLKITVYKDKIANDDERVLRLRLVETEDLKLGMNSPLDPYTDIQFRFNNKITQPLWWTEDVSTVFFGQYSYKKFETIIAANPGFTSIEGMSSAEIRKIALNTKEYIKEHNITEEDGSPMTFPIY